MTDAMRGVTRVTVLRSGKFEGLFVTKPKVKNAAMGIKNKIQSATSIMSVCFIVRDKITDNNSYMIIYIYNQKH